MGPAIERHPVFTDSVGFLNRAAMGNCIPIAA